jgi:hypothetical protein
MEQSGVKRKREVPQEPKQHQEEQEEPPPLDLKKLRSDTDTVVDRWQQLPPELWKAILHHLSNDPIGLCCLSLVNHGWYDLVGELRKDYIRKFCECQLSSIPEAQRQQQFGKETFMERVDNIFTPQEIAKIHRNMVLHVQKEQEKNDTEQRQLWGMNIRMVPKKGKEMIHFEEDRVKPEVVRKAEEGIKLGITKRGGLPHLPPHLGWPSSQPMFGAQYNCRDLALCDFRCLFPLTGILYFFFDGFIDEPQPAKVLYYDGPHEALSPRLPPASSEEPEDDREYFLADCWWGEFESCPQPTEERNMFVLDDEGNGYDDVLEPLVEDDAEAIKEYTTIYVEFGDEFRAVCMYAYIFAKWADIQKGDWQNCVVCADPSG